MALRCHAIRHLVPACLLAKQHLDPNYPNRRYVFVLRIKKVFFSFILQFIFGVCFFNALGIAQVNPPSEASLTQPEYLKNRIIVKFKPQSSDYGISMDAEEVFNKKLKFKNTTRAQINSLDNLISRHKVKDIKNIFAPVLGITTRGVPLAETMHTLALRLNQYGKGYSDATQVEKAAEIIITYALTLEPEMGVEAALADFRLDPHVDYASPDFILTSMRDSTAVLGNCDETTSGAPINNSGGGIETQTAMSGAGCTPKFIPLPRPETIIPAPPINAWPNDPFFHSSGSWGQSYSDLWGLKKIDALHAWLRPSGQGAGVTVAVIDTGIDYNHPDLTANIWQNDGESQQPNGLDDDGNGYIDDRIGWDFTSCNRYNIIGECELVKNPDSNPMDGHGHGTHVAGTIAAVGHNAYGIIGVAWKAKVMAIKGLNDHGQGTTSELAAALVYAAQNGARVINNSWGSSSRRLRNQPLEEAVRFAYDMGATIVFAAGNSADKVNYYTPANLPQVISVGASDHLDGLASFSNYGITLDVLAPGGESASSCSAANPNPTLIQFEAPSILSTRAGSTDLPAACGNGWAGAFIEAERFSRLRGTSMAAPHVSGLAALIIGASPQLSNEEVRQVIRSSADDLFATGVDPQSGAGRIDALRSLVSGPVLTAQINVPRQSDIITTTIGEPILVEGSAFGPTFSHFDLSIGSVGANSEWTLISESDSPVIAGVLGQNQWQNLPDGIHLLRLRVHSLTGDTFEDYVEFTVDNNTLPITDYRSWQWNASIWGDWVAWIDERNGSIINSTIYAKNHNSSEEILIANNAYAPKIHHHRLVWQDNRDGNLDIYMFDLQTRTEHRITENSAQQYTPQIYEEKVVYADNRNGNLDIYLYDLSNHQEVVISNHPAIQRQPLIWGNYVAWIDSRHGGDSIYAYDFRTGLERRITNDTDAIEAAPALYEDKLLWTTQGRTVLSLYDLEANSLNLISPVSDVSHSSSPALFADRIVWRCTLHGLADICIYKINSNTHETLPTLPVSGRDFPQVWENEIVWTDFRNGDPDIYLWYDRRPTAKIVSPQSLSVLDGESIDIIGQAFGEDFRSYHLSYYLKSQPHNKITIINSVNEEPINNLLGQWSTAGLSNGVYVVSLKVSSDHGESVAEKEVIVFKPEIIDLGMRPPTYQMRASENALVWSGRCELDSRTCIYHRDLATTEVDVVATGTHIIDSSLFFDGEWVIFYDRQNYITTEYVINVYTNAERRTEIFRPDYVDIYKGHVLSSIGHVYNLSTSRMVFGMPGNEGAIGNNVGATAGGSTHLKLYPFNSNSVSIANYNRFLSEIDMNDTKLAWTVYADNENRTNGYIYDLITRDTTQIISLKKTANLQMSETSLLWEEHLPNGDIRAHIQDLNNTSHDITMDFTSLQNPQHLVLAGKKIFWIENSQSEDNMEQLFMLDASLE